MNKEKIKDSKQLCNIFIDSHHYISIVIDRGKIPLMMINNRTIKNDNDIEKS